MAAVQADLHGMLFTRRYIITTDKHCLYCRAVRLDCAMGRAAGGCHPARLPELPGRRPCPSCTNSWPAASAAAVPSTACVRQPAYVPGARNKLYNFCHHRAGGGRQVRRRSRRIPPWIGECQSPRGAGAAARRRAACPLPPLDRPDRRRRAASLGLLPARAPDGGS